MSTKALVVVVAAAVLALFAAYYAYTAYFAGHARASMPTWLVEGARLRYNCRVVFETPFGEAVLNANMTIRVEEVLERAARVAIQLTVELPGSDLRLNYTGREYLSLGEGEECERLGEKMFQGEKVTVYRCSSGDTTYILYVARGDKPVYIEMPIETERGVARLECTLVELYTPRR